MTNFQQAARMLWVLAEQEEAGVVQRSEVNRLRAERDVNARYPHNSHSRNNTQFHIDAVAERLNEADSKRKGHIAMKDHYLAKGTFAAMMAILEGMDNDRRSGSHDHRTLDPGAPPGS